MFTSIFNLRGAQTDRFRYEVFQNLFLSSMNTGFPRDTVATVPTVYGIETSLNLFCCIHNKVATVPTVYGIETFDKNNLCHLLFLVATVPTVYGIETWMPIINIFAIYVATVPTVYGIETVHHMETPLQHNSIVATVPTVYGIETLVI